MSLIFGNTSDFDTTKSTNIVTVKLTDTTFVVVYTPTTNVGYAKIGTISGETITYGSSYQFSTSVDDIGVCALSSTAFAISYINNSAGKAVVGTVSGTNITYGTIATFETTMYFQTSIAAMSATSIVINYRDPVGTNNLTCIAGSISGTSITFGTLKNYATGQSDPQNFRCISIGNSKFIAACKVGTVRLVIGTVSGTSITFGTLISNTSCSDFDIVLTSASTFIIAGKKSTNELYIAMYSFSGTTITLGNTYTVSSTYTTYPAICFYNTNRIAILFADATLLHEYIVTATIIGATLVIDSPAVEFVTLNSNINKLVTVNSTLVASYVTATTGTSKTIIELFGKIINGITFSKWNGIAISKFNGI